MNVESCFVFAFVLRENNACPYQFRHIKEKAFCFCVCGNPGVEVTKEKSLQHCKIELEIGSLH